MSYPVSACCFIRDTFRGAFCLFESMASILPFVDEFIILDLGSVDGTLETLKDIEKYNTKVRVERSTFPEVDAGVFATLANDLIAMCRNENVWYFQADEIWHENLLKMVVDRFNIDIFDLAFWRIQYRENFQKVKWFPHVVHRVGKRSNFNFVGDGMNSDRYMEPTICSDYGGAYFQKWGDMGQEGIKSYVDQMVLDVSLVGAFLENIPERRGLHAPFWHEEPHIENKPANEWMDIQRQNLNWSLSTSPYNIPHIMKWHVGRPKYNLRPSLFRALKDDTTMDMLGLEGGWR